MFVQRLGKKLMSDQSDVARKQLSDKLCQLLDVQIDCYENQGFWIFNETKHPDAVYLPQWLIKKIVRLRPALTELNETSQYENKLIHTIPVDYDIRD